MANIQVTHSTNINNAHSESAIVINPNNPQQAVAISKRFNNLHTYDFTLATEYSTDGGNTWHDSAAFALPAGATVMTDPTLAWDDVGNVFSLGLVGNNPPTFNVIGMAMYKSTDGGQTWSAPNMIHSSPGDDKQWMAGDTNPASPFHGRVYAVWDDGLTMRFARTLDGGATWVGTIGITVNATNLAGDSFSPEINVASNGDIYIAWIDRGGNNVKMLKSTDGGDSFTPTAFPATGITRLELGLSAIHGWNVFPGGSFRVVTTPTACAFNQTVIVAWDDYRDGLSRIYYALSTNGGTTWATGPSGQPLLTGSIPSNMQHFFPQMIVDPNGVVGCSFYEFGPKPTTPLIDVMMAQSFDNGTSFQSYTVTDQPWDPAVAAPWAHHSGGIDASVTFIGDYFGIDSSPRGFYPLWTDTRTGIQELFTAIVPEKKCSIVMNRSTLGQDEISARRMQPANSPGGLPVPDAFRIIMDGFTAAELGINNSSANLPVLPVANPGNGMTIIPAGNSSTTGSYGPEAQRFTFFFNLNFTGNSAFNFSAETRMVTISINVFHQVASAQLELIKQPNPFILHGDPYWLSIDLRIFVVRQGESKFGVPGITSQADAPRFIGQMIGSVTAAQFDSLSTAEDHSKLYVQPADENGHRVYNFALAKVRYIGLIGASNVRMFFRMFQAQTTAAAYDQSSTYRRWPTNPDNQPIALPGIHGNEFTTIPFFASARVDSTATPLTQQTDPANVKTITAIGGPEVDTFFGCWLDINQPFKPGGMIPNLVLPVNVPANLNGPFTDPANPPLTIQQSIMRNLHQCLVAEIAFDPVSIPPGKTPADWDKLAQRNIAWSDVGSAQGVTGFEIKSTAASLPKGAVPDELMIDWGGLPAECKASVYLPGISADTILSMASRMYTLSRFTRTDEHTLQCFTRGITYIPVPAGTDLNYAGLLTIDMPDNVSRDKIYNIAVRQITHATGTRTGAGHNEVNTGLSSGATSVVFQYRKISGAFQLTIPVKNKATLLQREMRDLSVLKWIAQSIPFHNRWYAVFQRYLTVIGDRATVFGGNPSHVFPSPTGDGKRHPLPGDTGHGEDSGETLDFTGKISRILFDSFGDFDGFILKTKYVDQKFYSREIEVEMFAEKSWRDRLLITVIVKKSEPYIPLKFIVHEPPSPFRN